MNANILVVDDISDNLRLLTGLLTEDGYEVSAASDGEFGLESARLSLPDLILLDIRMPDMDGYSVCDQLKADPRTRDIPVIFISALNETDDKIKGFGKGAVDYITKPFQTEEVLARVRTHLTLRTLQKELQDRNLRLQQELVWRKQAEEELRVLNQQLQEANRQLETTNQQLCEMNASKDKFFSIIAHDLRSPFAGIIALTEVIKNNLNHYHPEELQRFLHLIHQSVEHTDSLLTNLLEWSRLERGLITATPKMIPLTMLVASNMTFLSENAARKQLTLRNLSPQELMVYVDLNMLNTVIRNLLSNAVKFTAPGGVIEVSGRPNGDTVEVVVKDTGIGIPPDIFAKLFRIDAKYSRRGTANETGTGLGLILCKELVEKNGGAIRVESEVGRGTTFRLTLPRWPLSAS